MIGSFAPNHPALFSSQEVETVVGGDVVGMPWHPSDRPSAASSSLGR